MKIRVKLISKAYPVTVEVDKRGGISYECY